LKAPVYQERGLRFSQIRIICTDMSLHIIVDGYNVIRQSKQLRVLDSRDIQEGREALQDALVEYRKRKGHRITIVFDGTNTFSYEARRQRFRGITILFSRNGETADTVIKRMATRERERALVVSSDRDIVSFVRSMGSASIGSRAFEDKLFRALYSFEADGTEDLPQTGWVPTTRKKGPSRRLPKKKRRNRKKTIKL
jgi:predicted RNA-binding protein with PIN domain